MHLAPIGFLPRCPLGLCGSVAYLQSLQYLPSLVGASEGFAQAQGLLQLGFGPGLLALLEVDHAQMVAHAGGFGYLGSAILELADGAVIEALFVEDQPQGVHDAGAVGQFFLSGPGAVIFLVLLVTCVAVVFRTAQIKLVENHADNFAFVQ